MEYFKTRRTAREGEDYTILKVRTFLGKIASFSLKVRFTLKYFLLSSQRLEKQEVVLIVTSLSLRLMFAGKYSGRKH